MTRILETRWANRLRGNVVQILAYHSIDGNDADDLTISPGAFREQMAVVVDRALTVISLDEALTRLDHRQSLRRRLVLTFDDGYADFLDHALPVLESLGFPATVFAVTDKLGRASDWNHHSAARRTMSIDELRLLSKQGYTIGSHSSSHPKLPALTQSEIESELTASREFLDAGLGLRRLFFAYPYGVYTKREASAVQRAGYACACGTDGFWGNDYTTDRYALHRLVVQRRYSTRAFRSIVSSLFRWPLIGWPRQRTIEGSDGADTGDPGVLPA